MPAYPFRISPDQSVSAKAKQALMTGAKELQLFTYRQRYQLGNAAQRASLLHTLNTEFDVTVPLPAVPAGGRAVFYLIVADGVPVLLAEDEVLPAVVLYALAKGGLDAARRVSYRPETLPAP